MHRYLLAICVASGAGSAQQFVFDTDPSPPVPWSAGVSVPVAAARGWFGARDASNDYALHVTDGTVAGTSRVWEGWSIPIAEFAGRAVFTAANVSQTGTGLFCSDGTIAGTIQLLPSMESVVLLGSCSGRLLLSETLPLSQKRIWSTDLTPAGTFPLGVFGYDVKCFPLGNRALLFGTLIGVADGIFPTDGLSIGPAVALPPSHDVSFQLKSAPELGGHAYFIARYVPGTTVIDELWRTDGVTATPVVTLGPSGYRQIARAGNGLVIGGDVNTTTTLFSDGTAAGTSVMTQQVRAIDFKTVGALAFFSGLDATNGSELWRTDGTAQGTFLLLDATPGPANSSLSTMIAGASTLYCYIDNQYALLASDGTVAGTRILPQSVPPVANSGGLAVLGDIALVRSNVGDLLATDGTLANTVQLTSVAVRRGMEGPFHAAPLLTDLCFVSDDSLHGRELWRTDGTPAGTMLVEDIAPGAADAVGQVVAMRGSLWFGVGGVLSRSDGTAAGRTPVFTTNRVDNLQAGHSVVSFTNPLTLFASIVSRSNGVTTVSSPNVLGPGASPLQVGDATYYIATSASHLFHWTGEPNGGVDLGPATMFLGRLGDRVVFASGATIRVTDGTVAGTQTLGVMPHAAAKAFANRRDNGTFVVVVSQQGAVYATDGASFSALPLPVLAGSLPAMTGGDDLVYVQGLDAVHGYGLFVTDGTVAGTQRIADFGVASTSSAVGMWPLGTGNRVLLSVRGDGTGVEPWISDGTALGTTVLADLNPNGSSYPQLLGVAGGIAFFIADNGVTGRELWRLDLAQVGAATVQELGVGCPGTAGEPRLTSGDSPRLGTTFTAELSQALPNTIALWFVGAQPGSAPVGGGCTIYFQSLLGTFWNVTDGGGRSVGAVVIPSSPALLGLALIEQVGVFDPLGASPFGTSTTPGLYWGIGI